ncbi:MAG: heterodisulfide reductase subunit B [Candidatus Abyssobacteria bacterium SURF_17]|jgi:heterodisulfide reductase subunit B|uniref:Heterodisulfide reductase subunit B n=1 Tax=Candidatus Abyssobacteria bacterium SURF_17 TaxID=2093361 RepID=A0A419EUU2_9BACT|nr:MAG: heterodisulfide reductase subunit B [Candidatus Abyssubacteria bacterium SURF_17]
MKVAYYPGCSLHGTAQEYDESTRMVCKALDIELEEIDDWNCCGASSAHSTNDKLSVALAARNLALAEKTACSTLTVPCSACFQRLKAADFRIRENAELAREITSLIEMPYSGNLEVLQIIQILARPEIVERVREKVKKPLKDLRTVCYYGCLTVRPPKVTKVGDYEDPMYMDVLMQAVGADNRFWSYKTECCSGGLAMARSDVTKRLSGILLNMADEADAECVVLSCPMCHANLETRQSALLAERRIPKKIPIFYVTELLALAMDIRDVAKLWPKHLVDPRPLLVSKGLG